MCCSSLIHRKHVRNEHRRRISWFLFPSSTQKWPCRDFFAKWENGFYQILPMMHSEVYAHPLNCPISKTVNSRPPVLDLIKRIRPFVIDFVSN